MSESRLDAGDKTRRLLDAILPVAADLSLPVVLRQIVQSACDLVGARYGALGVLGEDRRLAEFITIGADAETVAAIGPPPEGKGILGLLIVDPKPIRLADLSKDMHSYGFPANHPPMRSFLGVPVKVRGEAFGNLYLTEKTGAPEFTAEDEELAIGLAAAAGVAIENARLHARVREFAVLEDRDRIARDLHDKVIQRLYATGMSLTGAIRIAINPEVAERLERAVDDLDATIRDIRSTIYSLHSVDRGVSGLRADVLQLVARSENMLGFSPAVSFAGLVDTVVPEGIGDHLLAALREALTNVARHANARHVQVVVTAGEKDLELKVVDDGRGIADDRPTGSGLQNLAARAAALGGDFLVAAHPRGGTELTWRVPLSLR